MDASFPFLIGRVSLTKHWSTYLPFVCQRRIDNKQLVLWRPGFTIWLSVWNNHDGASAEKRKCFFAERASSERYDEVSREHAGILYYSYRLDEPSKDGRAPAFQGFAFSDQGHLQMSIYFDNEPKVKAASNILYSTSGAPPTLRDPSILSKSCFATGMVMQDRHQVGYMYREEPDDVDDSGWRFFSGQESQDYVDDPSNTDIYPVAIVAQRDPAIIRYLAAGCGHYGRSGDTFHKEG